MNTFERIENWNKERNIPMVWDKSKEAGHIAEELSELLRASSLDEEIDALCDIVVFATGAMLKLGYEPTQAMHQTLLEIESRGGSWDLESGKWKKEITGNEIKADYSKAKR